MIGAKITYDLRGLKKINKNLEKAKVKLTEQVLLDSNFFIPKDTGLLEASSQIHSNIENGELVWDTPYAKRLYWNPQYNFSKDVNPNATGLWFEHAKSKNMSEWIEVYKGVLNEN